MDISGITGGGLPDTPGRVTAVARKDRSSDVVKAASLLGGMRNRLQPRAQDIEGFNKHLDSFIRELEALRIAVPEAALPVVAEPVVPEPEPEAKPAPRKRTGTDFDRMKRGGEDRSE